MMRPKRGFKLRGCFECNRARHCWKVRSLPDFKREWQCSQGHTWIERIPTVERVVEALKVAYLDRLPEMLDAGSMFYTTLRKR